MLRSLKLPTKSSSRNHTPPVRQILPKQSLICPLATAMKTRAYEPPETVKTRLSSSTIFARYIGNGPGSRTGAERLPRHRAHRPDPPKPSFQPGSKARPPRSIHAPPDLLYAALPDPRKSRRITVLNSAIFREYIVNTYDEISNVILRMTTKTNK